MSTPEKAPEAASPSAVGRPVLCSLPIGRAWTDPVRAQFRQLVGRLTERVHLDECEPASGEMAVLKEVERFRVAAPDALLLPALHGGSARALVLAATKAKAPAIIWCHDDKHSLASSCLAMEALRQLGHPCTLVHGSGPKASAELVSATLAATAVRRLSEVRIGQLGPLHPNLVPCEVSPLVIQRRFGAWVVPLSIAELRRRVDQIAGHLLDEATRRLRARSAVAVEDAPLRKALSIHLVLRDLAAEQRLDVIAVDCWTETIREFGVNPCLGFWFDGYRIACERDLVLALTMVAGEAISGSPGYAGDLYSLDEDSGELTSMHCGACARLHSKKTPVEIVTRNPPGPVEEGGIVVACRPVPAPGSATVVLLHGAELDRLHLRACEITGSESADQMVLRARLSASPARFRSEAAGNHYVFFPGDWVTAWEVFARYTGIQVH